MDINERRVVERTSQLAAANEQLKAEIAERKRSEDALRESEARLQAAIDAAHIGLWDWDLVSGHIISQGHHDKLLGFAPGEFDGTYPGFEKCVHPEDLKELNRVILRARDEGSEYAHEYRVIWPDGSIHWIIGRGRFVYDENGQPIRMYGAVLDITARKRAEEALRLSEARYRAVIENQTEFIVRWRPDGRRTFANEAYSRYFGLTPEQTISASFIPLIAKEDQEAVQAKVSRLVSGDVQSEIDIHRVIKPDGSTGWQEWVDQAIHDETGQIVEFQSVGRDITGRMQAEEAIRQQSVRAQLLAEISQTFAEAGLNYPAVLRTITRRIAELYGDTCIFFQFSEDRQRYWSIEFHHPNPHVLAQLQEHFSNDWSGSVDAPVSKILAAGEPVLFPVVTSEDIQLLIHPIFSTYIDYVGVYSLLAVPLRVKDRVIGALILSRDRPDLPYSLEDQYLLQEIADRAALTIENARLFQSVNEQRERLRALSARLVEAQEVERRTIARELHDEVGQLLTGLQITLTMSSRLASDAAQDSLGEAQKLVEQLLDRVQDLSLDLRPAVLDDLGLAPALDWHFERYTNQTGIRVRFDHRGLGRRFAYEIETAAYRIIQEGLTNVARHAGLGEAAVRVWAEDGMLGLQIEDLGAGFDVQAALSGRTSSGLSGMQEQAELLGGQFTIESAPGEGTLITVELPLGDSQEGGQDERDDFTG